MPTLTNLPNGTRVVKLVRRQVIGGDMVYIGRPSKWGNPFKIGVGGASRAEVIAKYEAWLMEQPKLLADLHELKGKALACWCAPLSCHGDVLARLADALP